MATLVVSSIVLLAVALLVRSTKSSDLPKTEAFTFGFPFNSSYYDIFSFSDLATISNTALQLTPDSLQGSTVYFANRAGRVLYNRSLTLWNGDGDVASFNTTFVINMFPLGNNETGEGMAFIIVPSPSATPTLSDGKYLGLTNALTDGKATNRLFAIEFDTYEDEDLDPDGNHVGVDINSIRSNKTVSLSRFNITLAPINHTVFHKVWIRYDGRNKSLAVYIANLSDIHETVPMPESPVLAMHALDLSLIVDKESFFGFSASNGAREPQLCAVLSWNLTVEVVHALGRGRGGGRWKVITAGAAAVVTAFVMAALAWIWQWARRRPNTDVNILGALKLLPGTPREFHFSALKKATSSFDERNKLGQGGYGVVFRGFLPDENAEVAVKKFTREDTIKGKSDFLSELVIINRLRHRNLVKLLGWCHKKKMLLLVYEYMPNGSLDTHIFSGEGQTPISWNLRYNILKGVASALQYLHHEYEETVIHRDLKASNIMLDSNFHARLGDFGLARALEQGKTSYIEMEGVHGTMGYIAPECFHTGKATRESDVYALGAVLLEVTCGHRPWAKLGRFNCLGDWVWSHHRDGRIQEAVDSRLGNDYDAEEVERVLLLGLACMHPVGSERPKAQTVLQILSELMPVPIVPPFKPAFVWPSMGSTEQDTSTYVTYTNVQIAQFASFESKTECNPHTSLHESTEYSSALSA